ncbi:MAG: DUF6326 family protein [Anaerolineaceae bacterium]
MVDIKIILAGLWTALMLAYLLGDVLRIFSTEFKPGEINGKVLSQGMWMGVAVLMAIPIVMLVLSLILPQPANRWANIIAAGFLFLFNIIGLPSYKMRFDQFLIVVGLGLNVITVWYAWNWV